MILIAIIVFVGTYRQKETPGTAASAARKLRTVLTPEASAAGN